MIQFLAAPILAAVPWRLILAACAALAVAGGAWLHGHSAGAAGVQAAWNTDKLAQAQAHADAMAEALRVQQSLQATIDQAKKDRRNEIARIDRAHAAVLDSLRNRPEARAGDTGVPAPAEPGVGCTGAGLARPDAGFLARYAADAARLQSAYQECRAGYQAAKEQLDGAVNAPAEVRP